MVHSLDFGFLVIQGFPLHHIVKAAHADAIEQSSIDMSIIDPTLVLYLDIMPAWMAFAVNAC